MPEAKPCPPRSETLRLGYVTGQYPRPVDTALRREVRTLRERGVHVDMFSIRRPSAADSRSAEDAGERRRTCYILPCGPIRLCAAHLWALSRSPRRYVEALALAARMSKPGLRGRLWRLFYFAEAAVLAREVRRRSLVHVHNYSPDSSLSVTLLAAHLGGFTYSFTIHGPGIFFEARQWNLGLKVERALFVCCISWFTRSQTMVWTPPEHWEKLHVVHCAVDPGEFHQVEHAGEGRRLLFVGRLASVKGLPVLLEAVARLRERHPAIELVVIGDGAERPELERAAARLGLDGNVRFLGYRSQEEIRRQLVDADVFVLPSFAEGVPAVLMEALASGVPAVATNVGGTSELLIDGVNGCLVAPGDQRVLVESIGRLMADGQLRSRLGRAGRRTIETDFNLEHEIAWLHTILEASLAGRREPVRYAPNGQRAAQPVEVRT